MTERASGSPENTQHGARQATASLQIVRGVVGQSLLKVSLKSLGLPSHRFQHLGPALEAVTHMGICNFIAILL